MVTRSPRRIHPQRWFRLVLRQTPKNSFDKTLGRKSGLVRKVPLLYLRQGEEVVMTASKGGMTKLPVWYHNVVAADTVDIQVGNEKKTYRMREATPEEEDRLWPQLEEMYPNYKEYRQRTDGVRHIPVLIFTPV